MGVTQARPPDPRRGRGLIHPRRMLPAPRGSELPARSWGRARALLEGCCPSCCVGSVRNFTDISLQTAQCFPRLLSYI